MSKASEIDSKMFIKQIETKKQQEAQKNIEDIINKLQNQVLTSVQIKYEIAKLNTIAQNININSDLKTKISDVINELEKQLPEVKKLLDKELLDIIEKAQQGFTGEGLSDTWSNNVNNNFKSTDEYSPYKIDGNSTLSTFL